MTVSRDGDIYAGMDNDGIWKSSDDGVTWAMVYSNQVDANGFPIEGRQELSAAPSDNNVIYALIEGNLPTIRRSGDAGATWTLVTNPRWNDQNCGVINPDWTRTQDWYDLTVAVDPNNPNRLFCGGVDLFGSEDGGTSWVQLSGWAGSCGRQFVHADQHALVFLPGSSDVLWNGNDGGLFRTTNATTSIPTFEFKGDGYNITQFYAGDIHPSEGVDYFLAGAQDNGTQRFQGAGLVNTTSATGGDGGFCHIDQSNGGQTQITSFTRNNYRVSNNGGASFGAGPSSNTGRFINPTDYDDNQGILYAASGSGNFLRWDSPRTGSTAFSTVSVNAISGTPTHVRVSPNVANRVYFGSNGSVVRVDGANAGTTNTGTTILSRQGSSVSCVEIEIGNEDHIIATFSNYGIESVFETTNGTSATPTWTSIENNLPDMPIRWAQFNPNNSDQVMLATELGVWSTDNLNGSSTDWQPTNANLANVRVDMLKARTSDNTVIAATHGRGLYSTNAFNNQLFFTKTTVSEANANSEITFELEVFNNKTAPVTNVVITDVLDAGLEFVEGSQTCGTFAGNTLTINEASIASGATLTCTFRAKLPIDNFSNITFEDDMESGNVNWTVVNLQGASGEWSLSNANPRSPTTSWFAPNTGVEDNTEFIILQGVNPTAQTEFGFHHYFDTESGWDGGFIEASTDGTTWVDLGPNIIQNPYNGALGVNNNTNINGRSAWTGSSGGYIFTRVDLSSFAGSTISIRFVFGEDDNTGGDGWYIDDVQLLESYIVPNMACVTTNEGDDLCDNTSTIVFECEFACFTCFDNIRNGDETGVDCGGDTCVPCDCTTTDPDLTYMNVTIPNGTVDRVTNSITTTDATVIDATNVRLYAGDHIDVNAELTVDNGGELEMSVDDCTEVPMIIQKEVKEKKQ